MASRTITGLSPIAEQIVQERMMLIASKRIESAMQAELRRTWSELSSAAGNTGETADIVAAHGERVAQILTTNWVNIWSQFGRRIAAGAIKSKRQMHNNAHELKAYIEQQYGSAFLPNGERILSAVDDAHGIKRAVPLTPIFDEARQQWISLFGAVKVTQITSTTAEQAQKIINQAIADAVAAGLDERGTAALLRSRMAEQGAMLSRLRSRVIARTEAHNASTAATQAAAEAAEIPMRREWVASDGERTREDHLNANGQIVGMYEPFSVGGEALMYPGDANGSAEQVINCRCVVAYMPD